MPRNIPADGYPRLPADGRPEPAGTTEAEHGPLERFHEARVVLIDDEPANLALLMQLLRRKGLRNLHAISDSRQALTYVSDNDPDLVLLDLQMPGIDGYELLAALREQAAGSYLPVLVLTADTTHQAINRALDLGARDFVTKPFDIDEVTLRVRNLLETKELHNTLRHHNISLRRQLGDFERAAESEEEVRQAVLDRVSGVLATGEIAMVFQPIVQIPGDNVVGCEALARFHQQPRQGPDRWFADAERVGLGIQLELLAVANALARLPELPAQMFMAVNVSPPTALAVELHHLLDQVDGERIVLELTEHVPVEDYEAVDAGLSELRRRGVRLASDDTGAGYAGFRHLLGLSPDIIKLDISLSRDIDQDPVRRALAGALVAFARDVHAQVIAEGVENSRELNTLGGLNVPWLQGFHLGRPGELVDVTRLAG
jgi:EAL domain-containing protein (putative c-di-GMP-specific phosphodiesterase class I)/AmiR/NasT family two-component response regulator